MNKEVVTILRKVQKQGARLEQMRNGSLRVHGQAGFYIVHMTPSGGGTMAILRKELRRIGFIL